MGNCNCMKENDRSEIKLEIGRAREIGNHVLIINNKIYYLKI